LGGASAGGGKAKVNLGAMQSQLGRNLKMAQSKERMQKKLDEHRAAALAAAVAAAKQQQQQQQQQPKQIKHSVYQTADGGRIEKTPRAPVASLVAIDAVAAAAITTTEPTADSEKKKKKNKNKK
jgi:hypothetical protein